jgi:dTDP-4-dehydrorhamnose 3,5-epimerase
MGKKMNIDHLPLAGAAVIQATPAQDERGWFSRWFCQAEMEELNSGRAIQQINSSFTIKKGTVRGLHFQFHPKMEDKIVRCLKGSLFDVIVDLRHDSSTRGQWCSVILDAEQQNMVYIPRGFAHGFQTLEENCQILYLHTESHAPGQEGGFRYDSPYLGIDWPLEATDLSARDQKLPTLEPGFAGIDV